MFRSFSILLLASLVFAGVHSAIQFPHDTVQCLNQTVEYQCTVSGSEIDILIWKVLDENGTQIGADVSHNSVSTPDPVKIGLFTFEQISETPLVSNVSFTVQSSIDRYTVVCEDPKSMGIETILINIADIPASPEGVTIHTDTFTSSSVSISWTDPSSDCVTGYRYNVSSTTTTIVQSTSDPAVTTVTVEGLVPSDDQYCVVVTTIDTANRYSIDSDTVCLYYNVPPPVDSVSVTITSVSDTEVEIVVTWEPSVEYVTDCDRPSFQYRVSIFNSTNPNDFSKVTTVSTTHTFTGVLKGRTYNVTVLATNVIGEGTLAYTTIVVPGPFVNPTIITTSSPAVTSSMIPTGSPSIALPSTATSTVSTSPAPVDPSNESVSTGLIAGASAGAGIAVLVIVAVLLFLLCCLCKKKSHSDKDGPIPLKEAKAQPETGQVLYQDPSTIERHKAPTGDLYAMPDKSKRRALPQPEMATYQDPSTIQRQQAPTGDLYALPDKKPVYSQVNKDLKNTYADLDLVTGPRSPSGQPLISPTDHAPHKQVLYSDVQDFKKH